MGYIVGVDQGGTKTYAAVMDLNGNLLSYHKTEGCYFPDDGIELAISLVSKAVKETLIKAKIKITDITVIVAGITGVDYEGDEALVSVAMKKEFCDIEIIVCNDCEVAYYSGSLNPIGAVICAGTGINAALFAPNGNKFVMGDYLKSSLQGGAAIALRALEAIVESDLGVLPKTILTDLFLDFSKDENVFNLLKRYITTETFATEMISLVPKIIDSADRGDKVAQKILTAFSNELCACFLAALKRMDMIDLSCDIVFAGSVFKGPTNYLANIMAKQLLSQARNINIINADFEPIVGACIMGIIHKLGLFDEKMNENALISGEQLGLLRLSPGFE